MKYPKYRLVRDRMAEVIEQGNFQPNSSFMTENEAIQRFNVSRITVRQAFDLLEDEGLIYRVQGKGCFVAPHDARPTRTVAFLGTCIVTNGVESVLLRSIEEYVDRQNYNMLVCNTNNDFNRAERYLQRLIRSKVDAIIYVCVNSDTDYDKNGDFVRYILNNGVRCVLVDRYVPSVGFDKVFAVTPDNFQGAYRMTEHLISVGHKRIGFCGGFGCSSQDERIVGYQACLRDHGLQTSPELLRQWLNEDDMPVVTRRFMMMSDRPTAVFVVCDDMAYRFIESLIAQGVRVPEDMAVVGFDDYPVHTSRSIGLTTMRVPLWEEGVLTASVVVDLLEGRPLNPAHLKVPCELVVRESCGARIGTRDRTASLALAPAVRLPHLARTV